MRKSNFHKVKQQSCYCAIPHNVYYLHSTVIELVLFSCVV